ncbi:MAG: hypothetical protein IPI28_14395 [Candidatus Omnitrophica bacterium]|nr:hypothetical protein [Candidatus Omnitrophota bacterium]
MKGFWVACCLLLAAIPGGYAERRFPPPDFETGYTQPPVVFQEVRTPVSQYVDLTLLVVCLAIGTWLLHYRRSRRGIFFWGCLQSSTSVFIKMAASARSGRFRM